MNRDGTGPAGTGPRGLNCPINPKKPNGQRPQPARDGRGGGRNKGRGNNRSLNRRAV